MNKILIVKAHPSSKGFTHKIADRYQGLCQKNGQEVRIIDLYDKKWQQDFFCFEDVKKLPQDPIRDRIQEWVYWAEEIVFIFPIWWSSCPAIMKNFYDKNFISGWAYKYTGPNKRKKLLVGKKAKIFATCDGPGWVYGFYFSPFRIIWQHLMLGFCGIKLSKIRILGKMAFRSQEEKEDWLRKIG
jgi:putative NADPH-quinone reductase